MDKNLITALLISLTVHLACIGAVTIVSPEGYDGVTTRPRINFLGPILGKTAFDIMLESAKPVAKTIYGGLPFHLRNGHLRVKIPRKPPVNKIDIGQMERTMDSDIEGFLASAKAVPGFILDLIAENKKYGLKRDTLRADTARPRKIVYRPALPFLMQGVYGDKSAFKIRVKVLVDENGNVKRTEPLTTTGYPRLDIIATEYTRRWAFEQSARQSEWLEVEVVLKAGGVK